MSNRRRALIGENNKIEPLYIYAEGENGLRNGTIDNSKHTSGENPRAYKFMPGSIEIIVSVGGDEKDGYICITGVDFSKYTTLNIDCQSGRAIKNFGPTYGSHMIGYSTGPYRLYPDRDHYTEYVYTCRDTTRNIYTFNISNVVGDQVAIQLINEYGPHNGQADYSDKSYGYPGEGLLIYNIWLA